MGYTQEQVAERVGLTLNSTSRYETGTASPSQVALNMLAVIYGKSIRWLLGGEELSAERSEIPEEKLSDSEFLMRQSELLVRGAENGLTTEDANSVRDFINFLRARRRQEERESRDDSDETIS